MELSAKIISESKHAALLQEELKTEITNLKSQIAMESQQLSTIKEEGKNLEAHLSNIKEKIKSLQEQETFLNSTRDLLNKAQVWALLFQEICGEHEPKQ